MAADRAALERFEHWVAGRKRHVAILFTPWGEALIRRYYRETITRLSHLSQVETVAIQTNLSGAIDWLAGCDKQRVALWTTFHPGETDRARYVAKIHELAAMGIRHSVGVVALRSHFDAIEVGVSDAPRARRNALMRARGSRRRARTSPGAA